MSDMRDDGQPCRKCGEPVELVVRQTIPRRRKRDAYYFDYWLKCPGCGTSYYRADGQRNYVDAEGPMVTLG